MARLPQPGGDQGQWGEILNDFLGQAHNSEGQLKTGSVTTPQLADGAVTVGKLSASSPSNGQALTYNGSDLEWANVGGAVGDATAVNKGVVQLAGDLSGTAASPTVPGLAGKENTVTAGTTGQYYRGDKSWQTLDKSAVGLANVDNTSDANKPVSSATQTALNGKANTSHTHTSTDITDFTEATQDVMGSTLVAGTNVTLNYNDGAGTLTVSATPGAGVTDLTTTYAADSVTIESSSGNDAVIDDATTVNAGVLSAADKTKLDGIATGATANATDAQLRDRTTHTGTQAIATVTGLQAALDAKEPTITAGTTGQYYRGDKSWQTLDKAAVGLANADNTADTSKPVSTAQAAADNLRVLKAGDTMSGDLNIPSNRLGVGTTNAGSATIETVATNTVQGVRVQAAAANNLSYATFVSGDAQVRYLVSASGELNWSDGTAAIDTTLIRTAPGELTVNAKLVTDQLQVTDNPTPGHVMTADGTGNASWQAPSTSSTVSINAQTGTTYSLVLGDAGVLVTLTNAGAITLTVPTNASVAFPVGTRVLLAQLGAGQVTVAGAGGVAVNADPGLKIAAQYGGAELIKLATDSWLLVGRLSA